MVRRTIGVLCLGLAWMVPGVASAQTEQVYYYHEDAVGSVRMITDVNGQEVTRYDFWPFGQVSGTPAVQDPRMFAGKEHDGETGFEYFGGRYYAGANGRFTTVDPSLDRQDAILNPQRWNRYAYGLNNPLRNVDPDGKSPWDMISGWFNAVSSNALLGGGRIDPYNADYSSGQAAGDRFSITLGLVETGVGAGGGAALEIPSVGIVTIPAGLMVTHGVAMSASASYHLAKNTAGTGPKASEAAGTTSNGQATDKYGNKLGPSGKPQVNQTDSNTREGARNRALDDGAGAVEHSRPKKGKPHFHPTDTSGEKIPGSTHHNYPED